ncbi:MAG TPA: ATP-binding protein, partial [Solirubrobacterales bacterium]|nr:ATP-binding protein [Solirubrobacterales bacterium]
MADRSTDIARRLDDGLEGIEVTLPAIAGSIGHLRSHARKFARAAGATDPVVADIALAISEAATNVVIHGYPEADAPHGTVALRGS